MIKNICILILNESLIKLGILSLNQPAINLVKNDMQYEQQFGFIG